ncbi:hypothetical protein EV183_005363 [Coemansia sp. RSA 2336]|nr:hypothetical protein EV183_005363 [Coemansia sp. RSA 2336]
MNFGFYMPELSATASNDNGSGSSQQPTLAEIAASQQQQQQPTSSAKAKTKASDNGKEGAPKPIGMACRACRLRKIRCGGERPRCSYCVKKGYECVLTPHKKRGRPRKNEQRSTGKTSGAGNKPIDAPIEPNGVTDRGRTMNMPVDGLDLDVRHLWAELTGLQGLELPPELSALAANAAMQAQDASSIPNIGPSFNLGLSTSSANQQQQQQQDAMLQNAAEASMLSFAANYAFPKPEQLPDVNSNVNHRGSPASSAHQSATGDGTEDAARAHSESTASAAAHQAGEQISAAAEASIRAYFTYVHPWFPILHKPTFERQVAEGRVDRVLFCAVQAIAARFRDASAVSLKGRRPYRRGQRYARRAKELLPEALKQAQLSTLQAVVLLALYMSVSGQWQEGAAYERLAVQLAFIGQYHLLDEEFLLPPVTNNMGVYEAGWSEHSHPARLEVLSRPGGILAHEQRRRTWWAVFQLERFNGLAMGRPPIIKPGWHWVWLPCSEAVWAQENPQGPLGWEMGLADYSQRPPESVSNCRVDLVLALIMGQLIEQRTEMFRLFFPRVDRGTLFYDNLPTHSLGWQARLRRLCEIVGALERRIRQWHAELDRYADMFSARRHANFEIMGKSCQIHLYACVLQIREHLFEDLLIGEESREALRGASAADSGLANGGVSGDDLSSRNSSVDLSAAAFEQHTGVPLDKATYQRGYMARAKRPDLTLQFVHDLDMLAQRCWTRSVALSDEIAKLLRTHWLQALEQQQQHQNDADMSVAMDVVGDSETTGISSSFGTVAGGGSVQNGSLLSASSVDAWTLGSAAGTAEKEGASSQQAHQPGPSSPAAASGSSASAVARLDPLIADRFKLLNPQTPYHLFVAGKVQAARLKQAVTAKERQQQQHPGNDDKPGDESPEVQDAIRRINDIWDKHAAGADISAIESRLDDIISALEYAQLFWFSLNFASHLKNLKQEASKALLHGVYRT